MVCKCGKFTTDSCECCGKPTCDRCGEDVVFGTAKPFPRIWASFFCLCRMYSKIAERNPFQRRKRLAWA